MTKANNLWSMVVACISLVACSSRKALQGNSHSAIIEKVAKATIFSDSNFATAHIGISIYDATDNKYLYNYQGDKYFVPASNTKLLTCYAAMKYLGDSIVGLQYDEQNGFVTFSGTGDPTFMMSDFANQPVLDFLKSKPSISYIKDELFPSLTPWGKGWAWDDYQDDYMAERSVFPIYGNCAQFFLQGDTVTVLPHLFYNYSIQWLNGIIRNGTGLHFKIVRKLEANDFHSLSQLLTQPNFSRQAVPFKTDDNPTTLQLLKEVLGKDVGYSVWTDGGGRLPKVIHSQPTDSLLAITMHRSDNFFAEQTLLMVSDERLHKMSDTRIIDTLLNTDYKDMPQKPKWVDGSGLSRYNLITPQDFVYVLNKMKHEFSWNRITAILPTGNKGTLSGYYKNYTGRIYAKTGTLSNNVALSGYLLTAKGKQFIFSVLVNNHQTSATNIRREVEQFLSTVMDDN